MSSREKKLAAWIPMLGLLVEFGNEEHYISDRTKPYRYIGGIFYHCFAVLYTVNIFH